MGDPTSELTVRDAPERSRFEVYEADELAGFVDSVRRGDAVALPHTEVDPPRGGRGVATALVRSALTALRERDESVLPQCPFVAAFIRKNPEFADLVPPDRRASYGLT
jgi:predicted GNAT family acetyltransferase